MMAFILALLVAYVSYAVAALGGTDFLAIKPGCIFLGFWVQVGTKTCVVIFAALRFMNHVLCALGK